MIAIKPHGKGMYYIGYTPHDSMESQEKVNMAIRLQELRSQLNPAHGRELIHKVFEPVFNRFPFLALLASLPAVAIGYAFLFLFPLLAIVLGLVLPALISSANTPYDWSIVALSGAGIIISVAMSYHMLRFPFSLPRGYQLEHTMTPALFDLISELEQTFESAAIHRIIVRHDYAMQVIKTPSHGIPFLTTNTLVIGLPLLLSLSVDHFRALLARRICLAGGKPGRTGSHVQQLRTTWRRYRDDFSRTGGLVNGFYASFFRLYIPVYDSLSFYAARQNELAIDRYAIGHINDRDLAEVLSQEIVTRKFLEKVFWPKVYQLTQRNPDKPVLPYQNMANVVTKGMRWEDMKVWLEDAMEKTVDNLHYMPPLKQRLENIGHSKAGVLQQPERVAATQLFDEKSLADLTGQFDQLWLKRQQLRHHQAPVKPASSDSRM